MGAKRPLNGTSKVNRRTHGQTDTRTHGHTDSRTFWLIESIGPEGRCFEKQWNYDSFPCVSLAEFFSTTLRDDLGKVSIIAKQKCKIKICKSIMTSQHLNYTIEPVERFFFTLRKDSGHQTFFQHIHKRQIKMSVKVKTRPGNLVTPDPNSNPPIPFHSINFNLNQSKIIKNN